jgi:hypothetical protein
MAIIKGGTLIKDDLVALVASGNDQHSQETLP